MKNTSVLGARAKPRGDGMVLEQGRVIELKGVGGLHHQYVRSVA